MAFLCYILRVPNNTKHNFVHTHPDIYYILCQFCQFFIFSTNEFIRVLLARCVCFFIYILFHFFFVFSFSSSLSLVFFHRSFAFTGCWNIVRERRCYRMIGWCCRRRRLVLSHFCYNIHGATRCAWPDVHIHYCLPACLPI